MKFISEFNGEEFIPSHEARRTCEDEHGGYLPLPLNDKENAEYFAAFSTFALATNMGNIYMDSPNDGNGVLLGLIDARNTGNFTTMSDEETPLYTNWNTESGEPDNGNVGPLLSTWVFEDYVIMLTTVPESTPNALGTWNDFPLWAQVNVICEADLI